MPLRQAAPRRERLFWAAGRSPGGGAAAPPLACGAAVPIVYNSATGASFQTILASVGTATLPAMFVDQSQGADLKAQLAANPGVSATLDFSGATAFAARPDLTSFTSRGPSLGSAMKPDLVAVGDQIVTGAQNS